MPVLTKSNSNHGFTLVELLVVISIIAILAVVGLTVFSGVQKSARDSKRRSDMHAIQQALEQYKLTNGLYPVAGWAQSTSGPNWIPNLSSYFSSSAQPQDPINNGWFAQDTSPAANPLHYGYSYYSIDPGNLSTPGSWYMMVFPLENPTSADLATSCNAPGSQPPGPWNYRYGVSYAQNTRMTCNQQ